MSYCDVFISYLDSHSDGTHSLQSIHSWASDVMLHFSKSVSMKKQTHLHLTWHEGETMFSTFSYLGKVFLSPSYLLFFQYPWVFYWTSCFMLYSITSWKLNIPFDNVGIVGRHICKWNGLWMLLLNQCTATKYKSSSRIRSAFQISKSSREGSINSCSNYFPVNFSCLSLIQSHMSQEPSVRNCTLLWIFQQP